MFCLRVILPDGYRILPLAEAQLTIGAGPENDLVLDDLPELALRVARQNGEYAFAALHPKSRVFLNGKRCDAGPLRPGDRMEAGRAVLLMDRAETPALAPATDFALGEGLGRLCSLVAGTPDLQALLEKTMLLLKGIFQADEAFLLTLDDAGRPRLCVGTDAKRGSEKMYSDSIVSHVLSARAGICLPNALDDARFSRSDSITDLRLRTVLCAPILAGGKLSGAVYVGSKRPSISYSPGALKELEIYAMVAGCLIHHAGLIAMQRKLLAMAHAHEGAAVISVSPVMERVKEEASLVAQGNISVLLTGETGTGKDLLAQFIHQNSRRRDKPFVVVNCSTLRGELLASELFGHVKGAFTGAMKDHAGLIASADGGTLFLDEIGEMELPLQAMLLRVLETGKVRPVGRLDEIAADVRVICATNRDLDTMVSEGSFRKDLFYRINQHRIHLPALRERGEDILLLAHHFLEKARGRYPEKHIDGFLPGSLAAMAAHEWPGNVRELANVVERAILFSPGPAVKVSFPEGGVQWASMEEAMHRFQRDYLLKAIALCGGDREQAATRLGISRSTLFRYLSQVKETAGD
jgi:transcriptional regulator with GAF, ATPase, and Fis domain